MDRLTSEIVIDHISGQKNTTHFAYDFVGNICEAVDGNGNIRKYTYDDNNQLKSITYPDGRQENYLYGVDGNLSKYQDRNGIINEYSWNVYGSMTERKAGDLRNVYEYAANGQLTAAISNGMDYRYTYDKDGLLTAKKASGRTLLAYTYDELGRKTSQTDITGRKVNYKFDKSNNLVDICNEIDQSIVKFDRDADGAVKKITHANGMYQDIAYDADKNIIHLTVATPDKLLAQNTYRYDGNGQRIEKNELTGKTLYTYDSLNRLAQVEYPTYTERFTYDHTGNRLTRTAKDIEEQYVYDVNNRLMQRSINHYDAEGLRYEMEENGKLVQFIFNENKEVIAEQEDGNITRLIRTSDLWAMKSAPEKTWYHYASDEQGSTIFITDRQGKVKNHYAYDAFGNTVEAEEQISNRYQYTGQQFDPIIQQYYLRARFYNPAIARFTQEDEYHGDGLNLYVYCANNPVDYYDPSGYSIISHEEFSKLVVKANREGSEALSHKEIHDMAKYWRKNNPNPCKLSQKRAEKVMKVGYERPMNERVGKDLKLPAPSKYLPEEYIKNHEKGFANGAAHLETSDSFGDFYEGKKYFQRAETSAHHLFVVPKNEMDKTLQKAMKGDPLGRIDTAIMEKGLGYGPGRLASDEHVIFSINDVKRHDVHIPIGNEIGCNEHWVPGGYTEGMMSEGIAHNVKNPECCNDYFSKDVNIDKCKCVFKGV